MNRREEEASEFTVKPSGADIAYRWLQMNRKISASPFIHGPENQGEPSLDLTDLDIHNDALIHQINSGLVYQPDNAYGFRSRVYITREMEIQIPSGLSTWGGEIDLESILRLASEPTLPVSMEQLSHELRISLGRNWGYEIDYDPAKKITSILPPTDVVPLSEGNTYQLGAATHQIAGAIYALDLEEEIEEDSALFEKRYIEQAHLLQEVVRMIYRIKGEPSLRRVLHFVPPADTASRVRKVETAVSFREQQMNEAGFLDGGDDEDIQRRIVVEQVPNVTFDEIGGQDRAKEELTDVVIGTIDPKSFQEEGTYPPRGVLLYGPPGTGKTLLARATAHEAQARFFNVGLASIVHSLYGKTERYMQRVFDMARESAPSIVFIDELESLARSRHLSDRISSNIVNILLTNMDGFQDNDPGVTVIGATNMLELIDDALLRPGRFDVLIKVDKPNAEARAQIFDIHKRHALERAGKSSDELFDQTFDVAQLVTKTEDYSGADIAELLRRALLQRVRQKRRGETVGLITAQAVIDEIRAYERVRTDKMSSRSMASVFRPSRDR